MYKYTDKQINWIIASFLVHDAHILKLVDELKKYGFENPFTHVFGSLPCKLQGGRIAKNDVSLGYAKKLIEAYNNRGIGVRFTFSKYDISKDDLHDITANRLMEFASKNSDLNGVIVSSDLLCDYIREKYDNLHIVSSIVKASFETNNWENENVDYYNNLTDRYDMVVVNPYNVSNTEFLDNLKNKDKIEFLVNHKCRQLCKFCKKHYSLQWDMENKMMNNQDFSNELLQLKKLQKECDLLRKENPFNSSLLTYNQVDDLVERGFYNFKIEGREAETITFLRDIGNYVFDSNRDYLSFIQAVLGNCF